MISSLFLSCSRYPKDVREALKQAGNNREELEKVIDYYSHKQADSLKLKAAYFLIGNLTEQYYFKGNSLDIYNKEILKMEDKSVARLMNVWDSIYRIYGNDFEINKDIEFVNSEMLIENIEMSFKVWKKEWNQSISFDEFCEFILPYKSSNEKPQVGWRTELYDKYKWITDSIYNKEDLLNLCISTNKEFKKLFKLSLSYQYPVDLSFNMASIIQTGSCDMGAKTVLYPMRALGIPVSYDYAPFWANRSQKHNWNALIIDGKHKTFNGGDNDVGSHKVEFIGVGRMKYKPAKVFRKTYAIQKNSLPFLIKRGEDIPDMFKNKRIKDVTNEYLPVSDIHLNFDKKLTSNIRIGYLCTFNNVDWQIYYWGLKNKNELIFKNMGRDVAYLPVIYREGNIIPIGDPLILTSEGKIKICKANLNQKQKIIAFSKYPEDQSNNIFPDHEYELFYWKNVWVSLGKQVAHTNYLIYENAPTNALFWIRDHSGGKQERIFTYEHNEQIWW
jgi:hypothetical protein